jgi:GT2 family glycosyltransferase
MLRTVTGSGINSAIEQLNLEPDPSNWVWLTTSNSTPEPDALAKLIAAAEKSSGLTGIIGPKLVSKTNAREITQLGLTLTPLGDAFSPVSGEFDQGQHDRSQDVLAVSAVGMLVRSNVFEKAGGFDEAAPTLAADLDFSIRARMAGFRVITSPEARVAYDGKASELGKSMKLERRKAAIHLRLAYSALWLSLLYWLVQVPLGFLRAIYRIAQKRPDRIWAEIAGGFWGFFTIAARLKSRRLQPKPAAIKLRGLKPLRATWMQVADARRWRADQEESQHNLAAFARGERDESPAKTFSEALGWLWLFGLAAVSWRLFPVGVPAGANALPLGENLAQIFARAGASWQPIGSGFFAPSDPFNWVLLALGSVTFWAPQISIALLLFMARPIAMVGAWRVVGLFTKKAWIRNLLGASYALWPTLTLSLASARIADVVAIVFLPHLFFAVARSAGVGRFGSARSNRQTWSWVAASGLLLAIVGASAPSLLPLILLTLAVVALMRIRRIGYLFWIPLPLGAIFAPYAFHDIVVLAKPLAIFADPSVAGSVASFDNLELLSGGSLFAALLVVLATLAVFTKRWVVAVVLWALALVLAAAAWLVQQISYPAYGFDSTLRVHGSPLVLMAAFGLTLVLLAGLALDVLNRTWLLRFAGLLVTLGALAPLAYLGTTTSNRFHYSDGRVVPWLLVSQANSDGQMLVVSANKDGYSVQWLPVRGVHLEDLSTIYRFELVNRSASSEYKDLANLVGNMISANGVSLAEGLSEKHVQFVLVPTTNNSELLDIENSLNAVPELEAAGVTEFGKLWRVKTTGAQSLTPHSVWSLTKLIQVIVLGSFVLLAVPTKSRRKLAADSEIFVDTEEQDA